MTDIPALIKGVRSYAKRAQLSETTASLWVFNDGKRLEQLAADEVSITMKRLSASEAMLARLEGELQRGIKRNPWMKPKPAPKAGRAKKPAIREHAA